MPAVAALKRRQILACSHQRDFAALHTLRFRCAVPIHFLNLLSGVKFLHVMSPTPAAEPHQAPGGVPEYVSSAAGSAILRGHGYILSRDHERPAYSSPSLHPHVTPHDEKSWESLRPMKTSGGFADPLWRSPFVITAPGRDTFGFSGRCCFVKLARSCWKYRHLGLSDSEKLSCL